MHPTHARTSLAALLACAAALALATPALADHHAAKPAAAPAAPSAPAAKKPAAPAAPTGLSADPGMDTAMAEAMKYATPGPGHKMLESMVGDWDATTKMWMGPGEPAVSSGVSIHRMILGGRYLEQRYAGSMMGQPFEGYGLTGFDNRKGRYTTFWVDNTTTEMMSGDAVWDAEKHTLTATNQATGPDGKPTTMRTVTVVKDADTHVFSMYTPMNGQETLMVEITYTRRK